MVPDALSLRQLEAASDDQEVSRVVDIVLFIAFLVIVFGVIVAIPWYGTTGGREDKRYLT